mmetsp:Transcript_4153/g.9985  ORF Transcript_4153/g.9985 Transcript_4153/m.9985 type:complete len:204 (-) Transcript_4153:419-1030(-)
MASEHAVAMSPLGSAATPHTDPACGSDSTHCPSRHTRHVLSSDPDTISPLGRTARVYTKLSCPFISIRQSPSRDHRRIEASFPVDTNPSPGISASARTQSVCPVNVFVHTLLSHSLIVLSADPERMAPFSSARTDHTACSCPFRVAVHWRVLRSHTRTVLSHEADTNCPVAVMARLQTVRVCPFKTPTMLSPSQMLITGSTIV